MCDPKMLEKNLDRLLHWIGAADSKIAPILAIDTAMIGVLAALYSKLSVSLGWCLWLVIPSVIVLGLSILTLAIAVFPRTKGPEGSTIYFGGIASCEFKTYKAKMCELHPEEYRDDLIAQCHRNAQIAAEKYKWVKRSMICLFPGIVFWVPAVYVLYGACKNGN